MNYVYRVKSKYTKVREDGSREIEKHFNKYVDEEGNYVVYALPFMVSKDSPIVQGFISTCNDPKWQEENGVFTEEGRKKLEEEYGFYFDYVCTDTDGTDIYKMREDEQTLRELCTCQLCVDLDNTEPDLKMTNNILYINFGGGSVNYYNANIIKEHIPDIEWLFEDLIYKSLSPADRAKRKAKQEANRHLA